VDQGEIAFIPLAVLNMGGPGAIAAILGMASLVKKSHQLELAVIPIANLAAMSITYLSLVHAGRLTHWFGQKGIDAASHIVGFLVAAMGVDLIFHGAIEALLSCGVLGAN
jgi:multiple antibiotic resistance protein